MCAMIGLQLAVPTDKSLLSFNISTPFHFGPMPQIPFIGISEHVNSVHELEALILQPRVPHRSAFHSNQKSYHW
jgi:hypothetical protein